MQIGGKKCLYPNDVRAQAAPAISDWDTQVSDCFDRSTWMHWSVRRSHTRRVLSIEAVTSDHVDISMLETKPVWPSRT